MAALIDPETRDTRLASMPDWRYDAERQSIVAQFGFADFSSAFAFMTRVALAVEKAGHHPDWSNTYNRVTIALSTHDAGGLTQNDFDLAQVISALAAN